MDILAKLRADGMSSDEDQTTANTVMYIRRTHKWRSAMLQTLLKDIRQWLKSKQYINIPYGESVALSRHPAPAGLPESCYDNEWIQGATPEQSTDLLMTD